MTKILNFSVGICAYNEGLNIENLMNSIFEQKLSKNQNLTEIIVVASGCTDDTVKIVRNLNKNHKNIKLFTQRKREGKARAVNIFLKNASSKYLILQSADTIADINCYQYLLKKLVHKDVGLVAGKIIPLDDKNTFLGFANNFKWKLHHKINLKYPERPKVGELISFKKIFERIPPETAVDEASIEPLIHLQGFRILYEPKALIYNRGPSKIREYLSQRRRIYAGHFVTKKKYAYEIITLNSKTIIPLYIKNLKGDPKQIFIILCIAFLEFIARTAGYLDVRFKLRDHSVWKNIETSKKL